MGLLLSRILRPVSEDAASASAPDIPASDTPCVQIIKDSLLDPRSVSSGIKRTPIVIITEECEAVRGPAKTREYLETDIDAVMTPLTSRRGDPASPRPRHLVCERESEKKSIEVYKEEEGEEEGCGSAETSEGSRSSLEEMRRRLFLTPDLSKDTLRLKSGRTPLGVVSTNVVMKPWKGLDEERRKLGLENTPPPSAQPLSDASQSAPGKVLRPRTAAWDHNSTFVI